MVGSSEISSPSAVVIPISSGPPPPQGTSCVTGPLPDEEVRLPSGAVQKAFRVPCRPELGKVRLGFFIKEDEVIVPPFILAGLGAVGAYAQYPDGLPYGDGNNRDFDPGMQPEDNKVYIEADFATGVGLVFSNRTCTDKTKTECFDAITLARNFHSIPYQDGSLEIDFAIGNGRTYSVDGLNDVKIAATIVIMPVNGTPASPQNVCLLGDTTRYPSVEGTTSTTGLRTPSFRLIKAPSRRWRCISPGGRCQNVSDHRFVPPSNSLGRNRDRSSYLLR